MKITGKKCFIQQVDQTTDCAFNDFRDIGPLMFFANAKALHLVIEGASVDASDAGGVLDSPMTAP